MSERLKKFWQVNPKDLVLLAVTVVVMGALVYVTTNAAFLFGWSEARAIALNGAITSIFLALIGGRSLYRFFKAISQKKNNWIDGVLGVVLILGAIKYFVDAAPKLFGGN